MRPVSPLLHFFVYTFCSLQTAVLHCRSPSFASSFHRPFTALCTARADECLDILPTPPLDPR